MATWRDRQAAEEELRRLAGAQTQAAPITNEAQAAAAERAHPSQAVEGTQTAPGWADYLAGIQQVQQARPDQAGALPVAGGTPTLARQQFEESVRQFNEQMAFQRAVAAAQQASAARAAQQASAARAARTAAAPEVDIDEQSLLWQHLRGVVDDAVQKGQDWSHIRGYLAREYGDIQRIMPFEEAEEAAFTYYDQAKHPQQQPWHEPAPEPKGATWYAPSTWGRTEGPAWLGDPVEPAAPEPMEDIERLRRAFYGDRYDDDILRR